MGNPEEIGKKLNKIHKPKLDWKMLILLIILIGFGIITAILKNNILVNTLIYVIIGILLSIGMYFLDYRKIKKHSNLIYIVATLIMIFPYIGFGKYINGILYVSIFNITFSQAIVSVPLYLIAFIGWISNYDITKNIEIKINEETFKINKDSIKIILLSLISVILMLNMPSIVNGGILCLGYLIISISKIIKYSKKKVIKLIKVLTPFGIMGLILIMTLIAEPYRLQRITVSFNPEKDPTGSGYVGTLQNKILKNAKLFGEADTKVISSDEFIISKESQYTFIYLVGKIGIVFSGILILTIILISIKLILDAKNIKDQYGKLLIIGMGTLYIVQSIASILINVNLMVQASVNLPFVSYGGVYFIINAFEFGLVFSVYKRKDVI